MIAMPMRHRTRLGILLLGAFALSGCMSRVVFAPSPEKLDDSPEGKWVGTMDGRAVDLTFTREGKVEWAEEGRVQKGEWATPAEKLLRIDLPSGVKMYKFRRRMDGLTLTTPNDQRFELRRK